METLDVVDPELPHERELFLRLDTLDQDLVPAVSHQADNVPEHRLALGRVAVVKERSVDLHRIEVDQAQP